MSNDGHKCREVASVNAWNADMNLSKSERQQTDVRRHWWVHTGVRSQKKTTLVRVRKAMFKVSR